MPIFTDYTNKETKAKNSQNLTQPVNFFERKNHSKASVLSTEESDHLSNFVCKFRQHVDNVQLDCVFFCKSHQQHYLMSISLQINQTNETTLLKA